MKILILNSHRIRAKQGFISILNCPKNSVFGTNRTVLTGVGPIPVGAMTVSAEPIPEPLTIFGTAVALGFGAMFQGKNTFNKEAE